MDKKQLSLFPELDLKSNEPIVHDGSSGKFINKFVEKEKGPFESTLDNIQGKKLNKAEKQIVKVARQPDSRGMFKKLVKEDEAQYKKSQIRKETMPERIDRMIYQYDSPARMKKPKHYDNPNIIDDENWKQRPKKFDNNDPSTYPSDRDQRQRLSSWDLIVESAKGNPSEMKEIRGILRDHYKSNPKSLTEKELKMIGQHKSQQIKLPEVKPFVDPRSMIQEQRPMVPEKTLDQIIKEKADERLKREQDAWDREYGNVGLAKILRPE